MICTQCKNENRKSNVYPGNGISMLMFCDPYYDENGIYHFHDLNRHTQQYSCSNGHEWGEVSINKCACGWTSE